MGNNHSTGGKPQGSSGSSSPKSKAATTDQEKQPQNPATGAPGVRGMTRTASGADIQDRSQTQFQPVDKLGRMLAKKCEEVHGIHQGITGDIFARYVFPKYPDLGLKLFRYLRHMSHAKTEHLGLVAFRQQCEKFLGLLDDSVILETHVRMFGDLVSESELIKPENLKSLLRTCYNLAMAHYSDGPQTCLLLNRTLDSVVQSCFFSKESLSPGYICRWLENNVPRLVPPIHKYCVHALSTSHRTIIDSSMVSNSDTVISVSAINAGEASYGLELQTPILEKVNPFAKEAATAGTGPRPPGKQLTDEERERLKNQQPLLPLSEAWLLAGSLPPLYSKPQSIPAPVNSNSSNLTSHIFLAKLLSLVPSHWTSLYDSRLDGAGTNRFLHHVLGYRGPNLILFRCEDDLLFCVANPNEWRETHLYTGDEGSCCLQLLPKFQMLEKKPKSLYLNTHIRGYPKGLRAGSDPRKPILIVDEHFERLEYRALQHRILSIEVWGCGNQQQRDVQLDIKKWQVREAERQRTVKMTAADWMDHPDRYLLELGGRPNYNNSSK
uniref:TLDc domain-containing protein n=1 Tax=Anopheles triannulatus TaxID=58253 RepID=A0A2M4A8H5_9DIPT